MRGIACLLGFLALATAAVAQPIELVPPRDCRQDVPGYVAPLTDKKVVLSIRVLLDGVPEAPARASFARVQDAYSPLGIELAVSYTPVVFTTAKDIELIRESRAFFGGRRPAGTDVVYTLTAKDITGTQPTGEPDSNVAGYAECIGGIQFADRGFAIGEASLAPTALGSFTLFGELAAKIAAHEIAHTLGAQHQYSNCAEAVPRDPADVSPCTVMFPDSISSLTFGTLEAVVVRGYAQRFAGETPTALAEPPRPQYSNQPPASDSPSTQGQQPSATQPEPAEGPSSGSQRPAAKSKTKPKHHARRKHKAKKRHAKHHRSKHRRPRHKAQSKRS